MLKDVPPKLRKNDRPARRKATIAPPATPPTLVSAAYDEGNSVTLTFDRAVDVAGVVGSAIRVNDGGGEVDATLNATGAVAVLSPTSVRLGLVHAGPPTGPGMTMTATAGNGIVAVNGGAPWAGVTELTLPFG